tara:strand:+ start:1632 stop:2903 length:1272 start_codon:yes stop_codon:yes gene_type:complete
LNSEYVEYKISEIATIVGGGTPKTSNEAYFDGDIPWITPKDMSDNPTMYTSSGFRNVSDEGLSSCSAKMVPAGSILMSSRAPVGLLTISANPVCTNQGIRSLILNEEIADAEYVYYKLGTMLPVIEAYSSGATFPEISGSSFGKISIILPPINQQKLISRILRDLDSMIEKSGVISSINGHQISALFRSWFIDFDPVKAKAEGKLPYGMDEETAALFPDSFEDSELGQVPTGWTVGMMEDVLSRKQDSTTPGEHLSERHYVPIDNIDSKNLTLKNWLPYNEAASSLILFSKNDLLFGAMRPYFHKVTIAPFDGITRSTCFVFTPKVPGTLGFSLCLLNLDSTIRYSTDSSLGSTMPYAIWRNGLARHKIILPPPQIMVAFSAQIAPLIEKIRDGGLKIRNLSSARDALLPRLMSGELKVPMEA